MVPPGAKRSPLSSRGLPSEWETSFFSSHTPARYALFLTDLDAARKVCLPQSFYYNSVCIVFVAAIIIIIIIIIIIRLPLL